jgi:hypothetical protein
MSTSRSDASKTERDSTTREFKARKAIRCPKAPEFSLGDGNADKEAEKLMPSPNFLCPQRFVLKGNP